MAITVKHSKVSTKLNGLDSTLVQPSDWNEDHALTGLGDMAEQNKAAVDITGGTIAGATITGGSISGITDLSVADGGTGASDALNARANLGVGTLGAQNANDVSISGGTVSGITDLAIADGGTGASNSASARTNLNVYSKTEASNMAFETVLIFG